MCPPQLSQWLQLEKQKYVKLLHNYAYMTIIYFFIIFFSFTIEVLRGFELWGVIIDIHNINSDNSYKQANNILLIFNAFRKD